MLQKLTVTVSGLSISCCVLTLLFLDLHVHVCRQHWAVLHILAVDPFVNCCPLHRQFVSAQILAIICLRICVCLLLCVYVYDSVQFNSIQRLQSAN